MRISDWSSDVCSSDLLLQPDVGDRVIDRLAAECGGHRFRRDVVVRRTDTADGEDIGVARPKRVDGGDDLFLEIRHHPHLAQLRSEEHTSELQSLMRISYAVFCLQKKKITNTPK